MGPRKAGRGRGGGANRRRPAGNGGSTRQRILEAAARTFAERGFRDATVRDICSRAGANVAAVNYHFGSKARLEEETLRWVYAGAAEEPWMRPPAGPASPERRLRETIRGFGARFFGPVPAWRPRLLQRAMLEAPAALESTVRSVYAPRFEALKAAVRPLLPGASGRRITLTTMSIVGQLLYYRTAGPIALRFLGERSFGPGLREAVLDHVTEFTLRSLGRRNGRRRA
jgi:AcrR family transcriptional regulator